MDVAFVDDHLSVTGWPAWAEVGEALRATLGDAGGAVCAAATGFFPLAISASTTKPNKTAVRSECKRIVFTLCVMEHLHGAGYAQMSPTHWCKDCGIARRCKLFLGTESERGALVQEDPFVWPPMECRREFAAANLQAESYLEREHNVRWAAVGVTDATMKEDRPKSWTKGRYRIGHTRIAGKSLLQLSVCKDIDSSRGRP